MQWQMQNPHGERMHKEHIVAQDTTQASQVRPFFMMRKGKGLLQMPL